MTITIDDFAKVEARVGTVKSAEKVPDADKLLKIIFDFGPKEILKQVQDDSNEIAADSSSPRNDEERDIRQIMAAIAPFYPDPEVLVGKQLLVCTNLETRKLRGYESQGMIMATDNEDGIVFLVPEKPVPAGAKLH